MEFAAALVIPLIVLITALIFLFSSRPLYDSFTEGVKNGLSVSKNLLPSLIALMVGVRMFCASGAVELLTGLLAPVLSVIGIPAEILPLLILRPISGSASLAMASDIFANYSADSFPGFVTSVIMGSSDTLIYVLCVYFASAGVKKTRHAFPAAIFSMLFCILFSCIICRIFFG